jgi:Domain of unknown function (DUF4277)
VEEFLTHQDTALLWGKAVAPEAFQDDTVGRVLDRLEDIGTLKVFTACAVRAARVWGVDKRSIHFDTTSIMVDGEYLLSEKAQEAEEPCRITDGDRTDKRPDPQQFVFSTRWVDRAVPLWGTPHDGNASDTTVQNARLSDIATCLAQPGVAPGADIDVADAALVTAEHLTALGDTLFLTRVPATSNECGRLSAAAVAHNTWTALGVIAHTQPPPHCPGPA